MGVSPLKRKELHLRATGIIRRIDDLGRIVIPPAVRQAAWGTSKTEGMPIEIYYSIDGSVTLMPYRVNAEEKGETP